MGTTSSKEDRFTIPVSDLVVGYANDSLYLRSQTLGQEVIPTTGHMLNTLHAPNLYRFLREMALEGQRGWSEFPWGALEQAFVLPRVRFGRVILSPARWKLGKQTDGFAQAGTYEEWETELLLWRAEWNVPRHVYLTSADHRLLLDLNHPLHRADLYRECTNLKADEHLLLTETGFELSEAWVQSSDGHYVMECVFPLVRNVQESKITSNRSSFSKGAITGKRLIPEHERLRFPGGDWLFLKFYGVYGREEEFIGWPMREFCERVEQQGLVERSFYMRYTDPDPHIRLRFQGNEQCFIHELLPEVYRFSCEMQQEGLVSRLVVDTYDPEIERYGGPDLLPLAERLFAADSRTTATWIGQKRAGSSELSLETLGVISVIDLMESFGLSFAEQWRWLDSLIAHKEHLDAFRQDRPTLITLANSAVSWAHLRMHPEGEQLLALLEARRPAVSQFGEAVRAFGERGELYSDAYAILASVIHLHLNRLLGTDRERERKVMALVRHTLHNLKHQRMALIVQ